MSQSIIDTTLPRMTQRERFRRLMHFQTVDRGIHWEFGYIKETITRWHKEGLDPQYDTIDKIERYFGVDGRARVPIHVGLIPAFEGEARVIEERPGGHQLIQHPDGTITEVNPNAYTQTIPHYVKFPIANRGDWQRFKERLNPDSPERWQADWRKIGAELSTSDLPVCIDLGSFLGTVRNWIGFENLGLMCYDDRPLLEEIIATRTDLQYSQLAAALRHCEVDLATGWEDICFRGGPIISPKMFEEIVIPHVRRCCNLLREHGCDVIWTDCDGDIRPLVPLWLDAGLNCMFPLEVHPGSDPVWLRKEYGRRILLVGGLKKHEFAKGKRETLAELRRVEKLVQEGGYIPHGDHRIPDDVPYDNYRYYVREKLAMLCWPKEEIDAIEPLRGVASMWPG